MKKLLMIIFLLLIYSVSIFGNAGVIAGAVALNSDDDCNIKVKTEMTNLEIMALISLIILMVLIIISSVNIR